MRTKQNNTQNSGGGKTPGSALADIGLALWFLFVGFCFWSPYLGMGISSAVTAPLYAIVLVVALVVLGLRFTRTRGKDTDS